MDSRLHNATGKHLKVLFFAEEFAVDVLSSQWIDDPLDATGPIESKVPPSNDAH